MMNKNCYSCENEIENLSTASQILGKFTQEFQCDDCMSGANCFTCEACGDGLASEQVDYSASHYREWWCDSCTEDEDKVTFISENTWVFKEEENSDDIF